MNPVRYLKKTAGRLRTKYLLKFCESQKNGHVKLAMNYHELLQRMNIQSPCLVFTRGFSGLVGDQLSYPWNPWSTSLHPTSPNEIFIDSASNPSMELKIDV